MPERTIPASVGGRRLTLDPIAPVITLPVEARQVESLIPCGFRVNWMEGGGEDTEISLDSGAGVASQWLSLTIKRGGEPVYYGCIDAEALVQAWAAAALAALDAPEDGGTG